VALLRREPGADRVEAALRDRSCALSAVNRAELHARLLRDMGSVRATVVVELLQLAVVPFGAPEAVLAGEIAHKHRGRLSLGDAICIATAKTLYCGVLTADRVWAELPLGLPVQLVRD
jgi:PIN domain nuclease of toxin-antitoxin system